jgi:tetratricopeptide (TPR) repeat protein
MESDAFRLFIDRASGASSRFTLTPRAAEAVEAICRRLDGIPLAIELAAARARAMDVTRIRERLEQAHALLAGGAGTTERQRTLGGLIDWSYRLLTGPEQALFRRLSVFMGGWSLEAAEAVTAPDSGNEVLELLAALVEKSLVDYEPSGGEDRYRMLQTLQSFALERLGEAGEMEEARRRYVEFYVAYAEQAAEVGDQRERLRRLDGEWDNLAAAAAVSEEAAWGAELGLRLVAALRGYWLPKGLPQLGLSFTRRALERAGPHASSKAGAEALLAAGTLCLRTGDDAGAEPLLNRALDGARRLGLTATVAAATTMLAHVARGRGDYSAAQGLFEDAIATAHGGGSAAAESGALNGWGEMRRAAGDLQEAAALYEASLERVRDSGEAHATAIVMNNLAMTRILLGELDAGRGLVLESVAIARMLESPQPAAFTLMVACGLAFAREQWRLGARTLGGVETLRRRMGLRQEPADAHFEAVGTRRAREALGEEAFAAEHVQGEGQPYPLLLDEIGDWLAGLSPQESATSDS